MWRSTGVHSFEGQQVEVRKCLGVFICSDSEPVNGVSVVKGCGQRSRPATQKAARDKQATSPCTASGCLSTTHRLIACGAQSFHLPASERDGEMWLVWKHGDTGHGHPRPPAPKGKLSLPEQDALDQQVALRPDATAFQYRVGHTSRNSVPLRNINPVLADPRIARAQVAKSKARLGIESGNSRRSDTDLFTSIAHFEANHGDVILDSHLHRPQYIILQTPFMKKILAEYVNTWCSDPQGLGPMAGRYGGVTDIDHSYFAIGNALVTCVFSDVLQAWVPVLYAWINGLDTGHISGHFRHLFRQIHSFAGVKWFPELVTQVRSPFSACM